MSRALDEFLVALYAPGRVGQAYRLAQAAPLSRSEWGARVTLFLLGPALGIGWVILYATQGASEFLLSLQYNQPVDLGAFALSPYLFLFLVGGLVLVAFWGLPVLIFFAAGLFPRGNRARRPRGHFTRFVAATTPPMAIYYPFLVVSFWVMTTGARFFYGMRTAGDIVFTVALVTCVAWHLAATAVVAKNYFVEGTVPAVAGFVVIVGVLVTLLAFTVF